MTLAGGVRHLAYFLAHNDVTRIDDLICPDGDVFCCFAPMDGYSLADTMLSEMAGEYVLRSIGACNVVVDREANDI